MRRRRSAALAALLALAPASARAGEPRIYVDESGVPLLTDDPAAASKASRVRPLGETPLHGLWPGGAVGEPLETPPGAGGGEQDRVVRLVREASEDLARGESGRAGATLEGVLRIAPGDAEAHWWLAQIDRQRGRFASAESHLRAFLAAAGPELDPWRAEAERRIGALADERRLADAQAAGPLRLVALEGPHFRIRYDAALEEASPDYARIVVGLLEDARADVSTRLGVTPREATGVVFYGRAAYARAHQDRFSFRTVGFYDGEIHVASAAHPEQELRGLVFHEFTHAAFRDATGGDRPYWLNEGLAELAGRAARGEPGLAPAELAALRRRLDDGAWIPLRRLAPDFGGLGNEDAAAAYEISAAAAAWLQERTDAGARGRLLRRLGEGATADEALREAVGVDTDGIDAALRARLGGTPAAARAR